MNESDAAVSMTKMMRAAEAIVAAVCTQDEELEDMATTLRQMSDRIKNLERITAKSPHYVSIVEERPHITDGSRCWCKAILSKARSAVK